MTTSSGRSSNRAIRPPSGHSAFRRPFPLLEIGEDPRGGQPVEVDSFKPSDKVVRRVFHTLLRRDDHVRQNFVVKSGIGVHQPFHAAFDGRGLAPPAFRPLFVGMGTVGVPRRFIPPALRIVDDLAGVLVHKAPARLGPADVVSVLRLMPDVEWPGFDRLDILPRMNAGDSRISRFGFLFDTTRQEGRGR